jgi:LPXTG-motif cell wall-anchored protein
MTVGQLKILQEVITLSIFVPFSVLYLKEKLTLDYLWAGLCLLGAVFFLFRRKLMGA